MMLVGEGGLMGTLAPMMEACIEMMTAMTQQMEDGAVAEEQSKG